MDLMTINLDTLLPEKLIEGYRSLIWTERFTECGDFVMTTGLVDEGLELLKPTSLVKIVQSDEIMAIDSRKVITNDSGVAELRVEGRSFETSFENRPAVADMNPLLDTEYHIESVTAHEAIATVLTKMPEGLTAEWEQILERPVTVYRPHDFDRKADFQIPRGDQYSAALDIARAYGCGMRTFIYFRENTPRLGVEIYYGHDRSNENKAGNNPVIFSSDRGDFDSEEYLMNVRDHKNAALVFTDNTVQGYYIKSNPEVADPPRGLHARVLYIDGSDIKPPEDTGIRNQIQYEMDLGKERLFSELQKRKLDPDITFTVSPNAYYKFGRDKDYYLGDTVTVHTSHGGRKNLQVSEYIRSEDETGEREFPTMIEVPELEGVFTEL